MQLADNAALVIFSGGQDSGTCLGWALNRFARVCTVGFGYGQRHHVELECRLALRTALAGLNSDWQKRLDTDTRLDLEVLTQLGTTAMTANIPIVTDEKGVPNTFVPGRNLLFLTTAAALAWQQGIRHILLGVCEADFSGYPDCRDDTVKAMQVALNLGLDAHFMIHTPLMRLTKAQTWDLAEQEGGIEFVETIRLMSHTCYLGERGAEHAWGYGCGTCPACSLRARGWNEYAARRNTSCLV